MMLPTGVVEFFEKVGHSMGVHGMRGAVLLSLFGVALLLAGYSVTSQILAAMGFHGKRS